MNRSRSLAAGVLSAVPARFIGLVAPLVLIPFALDAIGPQRYGLWMTIASISAFSAFADLGIGNSLLTKLSDSYARGEVQRSRSLIGNSYFVATLSAGTLALVASVALGALSESGWLSSQEISRTDAIGIAAVTVGAFLLSIPISLISRIRYATGAVAAENAWQAGTSICSAGAFIGAASLGWGPTVSVAAAAFTVPAVGALSTITYFTRMSELTPRGVLPSFKDSRAILTMGVLFFAIGAATAVSQSADLFIASGSLGLDDAAELSVATRIMGTLSTFFLLVSLPLWPAAGSALAAGDTTWVRSTTMRLSCLAALVVGIPGIIISTGLRGFVAEWLGQGSVTPSQALLLGLTAWNLALAVSSPFFMIQNAAGILKPQLIGWLLFLAFSFIGKLALAPTLGLLVFPAVSFASFMVCLVPAIVVGYRRSMSTSDVRDALV